MALETLTFTVEELVPLIVWSLGCFLGEGSHPSPCSRIAPVDACGKHNVLGIERTQDLLHAKPVLQSFDLASPQFLQMTSANYGGWVLPPPVPLPSRCPPEPAQRDKYLHNK